CYCSSFSFCFLYLFFFDRSGHHRDLHSFPTRRSSDLGGRAIAQRHPDRHEHRALHVVEPRAARLVAAQRVRDQGSDREIAVVLLDRKSTRLNSSHVAISYAVFCLKKKKKKKNQNKIEK